MAEKAREPVEQLHPQAVGRYQEQKQKERELVEAMFRQTLERERERKERERAAVEQVQRQAIEQGRVQPLPPYEPPAIQLHATTRR